MTITIENDKKVLHPLEGRHLTQNGQSFVDTVVAPISYDESSWRDSTEEEEQTIASRPAPVQYKPRQSEMYEAIVVIREKLKDYTDEDALAVAALFPTWKSLENKEVAVGERLWFNGNLYKVRQAHTVQSNWRPGETPALYEVVTHEVSGDDGSLEHPFAWENGMVAEQGKYYTFNNITYLCIRDSGTPLYFDPSALVGNYFEVVE